MQEFLHSLPHALEHAALDCVKLLPLLFLTYLLMEFLEHHMSDKTNRAIRRAGRAGPALGALLGLVPQCGFAGAAASLYAGRVITAGTLFSVFLSSSDEMLPILISEQAPLLLILKILGIKFAVGAAAGFLIDLLFRRRRTVDIDSLCEREHCSCGHGGILLSALRHTLKITLFIFVITFLLEVAMDNGGEAFLESSLFNFPFVGELIAALIGLIPNCASSVVLTNLYLGGALSFGATMAGLLVNSGMGLLILYRTNRSVKDNIRITVILYGVGVIAGFFCGLLFR